MRCLVVLEEQRRALSRQRRAQIKSSVGIEAGQRILVQQRCQRIEIVQHDERRQARAQGIQAVTDQRGNHNPPDTKALDDLIEQV